MMVSFKGCFFRVFVVINRDVLLSLLLRVTSGVFLNRPQDNFLHFSKFWRLHLTIFKTLYCCF